MFIIHTNNPRKAIICAMTNGISPKISFQMTGRLNTSPPA